MFAASAASAADADGPAPHRMLFTGDILLSRQVAREIEARSDASGLISGAVSPWRNIGDALKGADFVFGNLEGAVGSMDACQPPEELCFAVPPRLVPLLRQAGFTALGTANNHSGDLGADGRRETRAALEAAGLAAAGPDTSPAFFRLGPYTASLVSLSLVPGRDSAVELADWVTPQQEEQARWLIAHGADIIVGAHPHVIQPASCLDGRPVFWSLGNHVFDQKYPMTKRGLIAACSIGGRAGAGVLTCGGSATETPVNSSFPTSVAPDAATDDALSQCPVTARRRLTVAGQTLGPWIRNGAVVSGAVVLGGAPEGADRPLWRSPARSLLGIASGRLAEGRPDMLFTVERHPSPIDEEDGPRPYVYDVTPHGLVARWRGSALAWPLLDATLMTGAAGRAYVCALHRGDSFVMLDDAHPAPPRTQVYAWNGFGFSGVTNAGLTDRCAQEYGVVQAE